MQRQADQRVRRTCTAPGVPFSKQGWREKKNPAQPWRSNSGTAEAPELIVTLKSNETTLQKKMTGPHKVNKMGNREGS